jgi:hypothetical protein
MLNYNRFTRKTFAASVLAAMLLISCFAQTLALGQEPPEWKRTNGTL